MPYLTVRRKAYHRKPYVRKSGTEVSGTYVPPATFKIRDVGLPGRGKKIFTVKKGLLTSLGYHIHESPEKRRMALKRADKKYGSVRLWRMLNAQVLFRKRTDGIGHTFRQDRDWVMENLINPREARTMTAPAVRAWESMSHRARIKARQML